MSGSCKKANRNKNAPTSMVRKAQLRWERNKVRRAKRQARIEAAHAEKSVRVTALRKKGAVARLKRRIAEGVKGLESTLAKAIAAHAKAVQP